MAVKLDLMTKQAGVWIDHREAVLIFLNDEGERTERMESGVEKHERVDGLSSDDAPEGDHRDRHFADHLDKYSDEGIRKLGLVESIFLFGPGEAKGEFQKRMSSKSHPGHIVAVETADKMTAPQIAAKTRKHFQK